jgi:hypothetical protein
MVNALRQALQRFKRRFVPHADSNPTRPPLCRAGGGFSGEYRTVLARWISPAKFTVRPPGAREEPSLQIATVSFAH